jgi:hypothetical protein
MLRRFFIDVPAAIVTLWYRVYVVLVALTALTTVTILLLALVLAFFGIRWGW